MPVIERTREGDGKGAVEDVGSPEQPQREQMVRKLER